MRGYSEYSLQELQQVCADIDREAFPEKYQEICDELERRQAQSPQPIEQELDSTYEKPIQKKSFVSIPNDQVIELNQWFKRVTSVLTIGGAFLGITHMLSTLPNISGLFTYGIYAFFFVIYVLGIVAAVRLFEKSTVGVIKDNLIFWAIQIPLFMSPFIGYQLTNGAFLNIFVSSQTGLNVVPMLGSIFQFSIFQFQQPWAIGINPVAILVSAYFYRVLKAADKRYSQ
ncbi:hypothetical protein [Pseudoalteromonas sp. Of7M-16]|uniref:hypothetical protein n=1 Tax=Pseudoalteromonas sp. Of7M-16 TaxID=2917756 RepID=UPI001EF70510|nr:hypothetical protein [Pseudoalteromonas sp. Of7M-16]MCG7546769.1 hypothetical protein [Pseudoalteromonas sp. Of7M-16]